MAQFRKKTGFRSKRKTFKKGPTVKSVNRKVKKIQDMIELKYFDTDISFATVDDNDGYGTYLNGIAQNVGVSARIGNEITTTSLQIRGQIRTTNTSPLPQSVRVLILWDKAANGYPLGPPALIGLSGGDTILNTTIITDPTLAPYTYETQDRFRILYDKRFSLNLLVAETYTAAGVLTYAPVQIQFKKKIKLNRRVKYDGTTGGSFDLVTNALWLYFISNNPAFANDGPTCTAGVRLYYKDA